MLLCIFQLVDMHSMSFIAVVYLLNLGFEELVRWCLEGILAMLLSKMLRRGMLAVS